MKALLSRIRAKRCTVKRRRITAVFSRSIDCKDIHCMVYYIIIFRRCQSWEAGAKKRKSGGSIHGYQQIADASGHVRIHGLRHCNRDLFCTPRQPEHGKLFSGRAKSRAVDCGHECGGIRYERMASDGASGRGLLVWSGRCGLDRHRTCRGNVRELADCGPAAAQLFRRGERCDHHPGIFSRLAFRRRKKYF